MKVLTGNLPFGKLRKIVTFAKKYFYEWRTVFCVLETRLVEMEKYKKVVRDNFAVTPYPFNQNLNYEKILRFSYTKVVLIFESASVFAEKWIKS
ncbi:MAG: hypothetical protein LBN93_12040 [Candidatus Symbiothrix sp.]|jgi:hypothetical protein|nr:hypothetical protein [Candidatus Symbiothrix sp.]